MEYGATEDEAIAALLHDAGEGASGAAAWTTFDCALEMRSQTRAGVHRHGCDPQAAMAQTEGRLHPDEHDAHAIMIFDEKGHHLGYVPRAKNEALARLIDAGKLLFGRVESKEWPGNWAQNTHPEFPAGFLECGLGT